MRGSEPSAAFVAATPYSIKIRFQNRPAPASTCSWPHVSTCAASLSLKKAPSICQRRRLQLLYWPTARFPYARPLKVLGSGSASAASSFVAPPTALHEATASKGGDDAKADPVEGGGGGEPRKRLKLVGADELVQTVRESIGSDDHTSERAAEAAFVRRRLREVRAAAQRAAGGYGYGHWEDDDDVWDPSDGAASYRFGVGALRSRRGPARSLAVILERRPQSGEGGADGDLVDDALSFEAYLAREGLRVKAVGVKSAAGAGTLSLVDSDAFEAPAGPRLISVAEASRRLGIPPRDVEAALEAGSLEGVMCLGAREAVWFAWEDSVHEAALAAMRDAACEGRGDECSLETAGDEAALTLDEAAERLGVRRDTAFRLVRSGELPAVKRRRGSGPGRAAWLVQPADLLAFQERRGRQLDALVPLRAVAARLGRHSAVLTRWVRAGLLRGEKRAGAGGVGGWWIAEEDALRLAAFEEEGPPLTVRQAAAAIGVSGATVRRMIACGTLQAVRYPPLRADEDASAAARRRAWRVSREAARRARRAREAAAYPPGASVPVQRAARALRMAPSSLRRSIARGAVPAELAWSERAGRAVWRVPVEALPLPSASAAGAGDESASP